MYPVPLKVYLYNIYVQQTSQHSFHIQIETLHQDLLLLVFAVHFHLDLNFLVNFVSKKRKIGLKLSSNSESMFRFNYFLNRLRSIYDFHINKIKNLDKDH